MLRGLNLKVLVHEGEVITTLTYWFGSLLFGTGSNAPQLVTSLHDLAPEASAVANEDELDAASVNSRG